jgi:hypothetical protein
MNTLKETIGLGGYQFVPFLSSLRKSRSFFNQTAPLHQKLSSKINGLKALGMSMEQ